LVTPMIAPHLRHGLRVAAQAERPYFDLKSPLKGDSLREVGYQNVHSFESSEEKGFPGSFSE
jgi:hypothetical protein